MEKKEFNLDLIAPQGIASYTGEHDYDLYFQILTERVNEMWSAHSKRKGEKKDGNGEEKKDGDRR
ncbi:MAG: hypothetical protein PG978_001335 [Wolbachia endosymbiont of Ctenocephalides felis wCfeF]|nr:MAG: hypothetical protein PG978_001335 [Wolbachia endosymbiont of Ctenocephalides felis wCfeF]